MKMKGGLLIKPEYKIKDAFITFIKNSKIKIFKSGSNGIIFKCILNGDVKTSPYEMIRVGSMHTPVKTILIKMCIIHDNETAKTYTIKKKLEHKKDSVFRENDIDINSASIDDFKKEVGIQTEVFNKTVKYSNPVCPSIIYEKILLDKKQGEKLINIMLSNYDVENDLNKRILTEILDEYKKEEHMSIGLIGMEIADYYVPFNVLKKNELYDCMARLKYIETIIESGFSQNDFHKNNFLINTKDIVFFKERGNAMLLDFGYAK